MAPFGLSSSTLSTPSRTSESWANDDEYPTEPMSSPFLDRAMSAWVVITIGNLNRCAIRLAPRVILVRC